jgi:integrase/recombinase XerD
MSYWPDKDEALLRQFVEQLKLRRYDVSYCCVLRDFQRFVSQDSAPGTLNQATLRAWLDTRKKQSSLDLVVHRAQLVSRFLDWLVARGAVASNPLAELRRQYDCHSTAAIVRALFSPQPNEALEALRPLPRYGSHLGEIIRKHVQRMQTLGLRYDESRFLRFDRFLQRRAGAAQEELSTLVREYAALGRSAAGKLIRLDVGRVLVKALSRTGSLVVPPARDRMLTKEVRRQRRRPYIYSIEEVQRLLETARHFPALRTPLQPRMLYTMLVLAYCAGLRLQEIVRLELNDIDLAEGTIEIRNTKFFKSRRLPLSSTALASLQDYLEARQKAGVSTHPEARVFCHNKGGYSKITVGVLLSRVIQLAGLTTGTDASKPRIHDLRHTMVVHRMTAWYREGINPQSRLSYLSAYLGHRDINSTLVYLTITQELLQRANERFRLDQADILKVIH